MNTSQSKDDIALEIAIDIGEFIWQHISDPELTDKRLNDKALIIQYELEPIIQRIIRKHLVDKRNT